MLRKLVIRPGGAWLTPPPPTPPPPPPPPPPPGFGMPFGPSQGWASSATLESNMGLFTWTTGSVNTGNIITRLNAARNLGIRIITSMTGGDHSLNFAPGGNKFDLPTWKSRVNGYNTTAIKNAVAQAVADRFLLGDKMVDEPNHQTHDLTKNADQRLAGEGALNKPVIDEMAAYLHTIFPTLPAGVAGRYDFHQQAVYTVLDWVIHQFGWRSPISDPGNVAQFRIEGLAQDKLDGVRSIMSMNIINGGDVAQTEMTPAEILAAGQVLGLNTRAGDPVGSTGVHGMLMWRYDPAVMADPVRQAIFQQIADQCAAEPVNIDWSRP